MDQETLYQSIREAGLRVTSTRKAFLLVLASSRRPLSAKEIREALSQSGRAVNKTTVYREIESLENIGVVKSIQFGERSSYYELTETAHHHHLVCLQCDRIEDIDIDEQSLVKQEQQMIADRLFRVVRHSLEFFGVCYRCQREGC